MPFLCPKCSVSTEDGAVECLKCGINFQGFARHQQHLQQEQGQHQKLQLPRSAQLTFPTSQVDENSNSFLKNLNHSIYVKQTGSTLQILTGWQRQNHYDLYDANGNRIGFLQERDAGGLGVLGRVFLRSKRSFQMDICEPSGTVVASLSRPFFLFFSAMKVETGSEGTIGIVRKRFSPFRATYDLCDFSATCFGKLRGSFWGGSSFRSSLLGNQNYCLWDAFGFEKIGGGVERQWNGVLNRMFTENDTYIVELPHNWSGNQKLVLLSAAISIDFDAFEGEGGVIRPILGLLWRASNRNNSD